MATAEITGTVVSAGVSEPDVVSGAKTIIITLTSDTWPAAAGGEERIYPDADITPNWGGWSPEPHWSKVNDAYGSENSDVGISGGSGDTEELRFANVAVMGAGNTCTQLVFWVWAQTAVGESANVDVKYSVDNGSSWESATQSFLANTGNSWQYYTATFSGLSLTQTQVNALAVQLATREADGYYVATSAVSCVVTYA